VQQQRRITEQFAFATIFLFLP
jgi:hypothetical protein